MHHFFVHYFNETRQNSEDGIPSLANCQNNTFGGSSLKTGNDLSTVKHAYTVESESDVYHRV